MGALNVLIVFLGALMVFDYALGASCPPKHKVHNNKPACHSDADCQKYGQICCPNEYNSKSCTNRAPFLTRVLKMKKYPKKATTNVVPALKSPGVYCEGVKCNSWEVCKPDPHTKQLKCQSR